MGRVIGRLSVKEAENAAPPKGQPSVMVSDGGGLYVQATRGTDGHVSRSWIFRYQIDGRRRDMGIGATHTLTLKEAREKARTLRQHLLDGIDPIEHRLQQRDARRAETAARITFKEAVERYIAVHQDTWGNAKHRAQWRTTLAQYARSLNERPVAAIDGAAITEALAPIWTAKAETAARTKQRIERVCQWIKDGQPMPAVGKSKRVKHLAAMPYAELPAFMATLRQRDGASARALEFAILTGCRSGEVLGATWDEIDLPGKTWAIPAARTKMRRAHRVPLSDRAIAILSALPRQKGNPHVFVGYQSGKPLASGAMLDMLKSMPGGEGFTVHGTARAAFRTWAAERTNFPREVAEQALGHSISSAVEAAYRRGDLFEKRRKLMEAWASFCASPAASGNVVAIRAG